MRDDDGLDSSMLAAGWRVLARHLRYVGIDPRKLLWVVRRAVTVLCEGELRGVLRRHRIIEGVHPDYPEWLARNAPRFEVRRARLLRFTSSSTTRKNCFSILFPVSDGPKHLLQQAIGSIVAQSYPHWEICVACDASSTERQRALLAELAQNDARIHVCDDVCDAVAETINAALAVATGEFVLFLDQHGLLHRDALLEYAAWLIDDPEANVIYADEDCIDDAGQRHSPFFKPDFDPEWSSTGDCVRNPLAIRTEVLRRVGGLKPGVEGVHLWELMQRVFAYVLHASVAHIPHVLYHARTGTRCEGPSTGFHENVAHLARAVVEATAVRRGIPAVVELDTGRIRVRRVLSEQCPTVTIVVPLRNRADLLKRCVAGLRECTDYPYWSVVLVDNGSTETQTLSMMELLRADRRFTIIHDPRTFNYSALCNAGVVHAQGEVVVLLNNDVEPLRPDWLRELVSQAIRPEIGMVGAMLYYPNMTIQHAGVILWLNGVADRPYIGYPRGYVGVDGRLGAVHTSIGMITACAAMRTQVYRNVGGMDETLPIACNDLDLCMRVRKSGLRNIITPYAELIHHESATRGYGHARRASRRMLADEARFRAEWWPQLSRDPTYNINLTLRGSAFTLAANSADDEAGITRVHAEKTAL